MLDIVEGEEVRRLPQVGSQMRDDDEKTSERSTPGEYTPTYSHLPPREIFVYDKVDTPVPENDNMTPSHDNLTSSKTADMGDLAHPVSPRPSKNEAKKFTFDCISPDASINVSDSRDVPNSEADKADAMEEDKEELRDVPMETEDDKYAVAEEKVAGDAVEEDEEEPRGVPMETEDDKYAAVEEEVGRYHLTVACPVVTVKLDDDAIVEEETGGDDPTVADLMVTLKLDDDGKTTTQETSGQDEVAPNLWYLCGMDPTDLMTMTTFEDSMKYLATASVGVETTETQPSGKESLPALTAFEASMKYLATASAGVQTTETYPNGKEYLPASTAFEASMKYLATASAGVQTTETQPNGKESLPALTAFEASVKYLTTASAGVQTAETKPNGKESVPVDEETFTRNCHDNLETIEEIKTAEVNIDPVVAETLTAACNRLLYTVANGLENLEGRNEESSLQLDESKPIGSHGTEALASPESIAPVSIDTLRFVDYDIEMAPSDEMENRSALVSPDYEKNTGIGDVCFDNLKVYHAYV